MFGQGSERLVCNDTRVRDCGIAFALSVTGIVDEQKGVAGLSILPYQSRPIERERAIPAECYPNPPRQLAPQPTRQIKSDLFSSNRIEAELDAIRRQRIRVGRVVRPRVVKY